MSPKTKTAGRRKGSKMPYTIGSNLTSYLTSYQSVLDQAYGSFLNAGGNYQTISDGNQNYYIFGSNANLTTGGTISQYAHAQTQGSGSYWTQTITYPAETVGGIEWTPEIQVLESYSQWSIGWKLRPETDEEMAARAAITAAAEAAESRADQLLTSLLTPSQAQEYRDQKRFELQINGKTYRINKGRAGNVQLIEGGKPVAQYCAHPDIWVPNGDNMVAQMLMLQTDEAMFLKTANRTALV